MPKVIIIKISMKSIVIVYGGLISALAIQCIEVCYTYSMTLSLCKQVICSTVFPTK